MKEENIIITGFNTIQDVEKTLKKLEGKDFYWVSRKKATAYKGWVDDFEYCQKK